MKRISTFVFGTAIGCAFGALAALALSRQTAVQMPGSPGELVSAVQGAARSAIGKGEELLKGAKGNANDVDADELRAKIEEARARIAAQVAQQSDQASAE